MPSTTWLGRRRFRSNKFVPSRLDLGGFFELERRSLAAPAFWRLPTSNPLAAGDGCFATAQGTWPGAEYYNNATGDHYAGIGGTWTNTVTVQNFWGPPQVGTVSMSGASTSNFNDGPQAPPGSPAINEVSIGAGTTNELQWTEAGAPNVNVNNAGGVNSGGQHTYVLGGNAPGDTTQHNVVANWNVAYSPPSRLDGVIPVMTASLTAGGNTFAVGGNFGLGGLTLNGNPLAGNGTGVFNGSTITWSATALAVNVTEVTPVGVLPYNTTSPPTGPVWQVIDRSGVGTVVNNAANMSGSMSVATAYTAHIV